MHGGSVLSPSIGSNFSSGVFSCEVKFGHTLGLFPKAPDSQLGWSVGTSLRGSEVFLKCISWGTDFVQIPPESPACLSELPSGSQASPKVGPRETPTRRVSVVLSNGIDSSKSLCLQLASESLAPGSHPETIQTTASPLFPHRAPPTWPGSWSHSIGETQPLLTSGPISKGKFLIWCPEWQKGIGLSSHTIENWITDFDPPSPQTLHSSRLLILAQVSEGRP